MASDLGYNDGKSFFPIDFSLHQEPGKNKNRGLKKKELKAQYSKYREEGIPGSKRITELAQDKITGALSLLKRNTKKWLNAKYVLVDSWFVCERFITGVQKIDKNLKLIGLMKTNRFITLTGNKHTCKASKIPGIRHKQIKHSKKLKCDYISLRL